MIVVHTWLGSRRNSKEGCNLIGIRNYCFVLFVMKMKMNMNAFNSTAGNRFSSIEERPPQSFTQLMQLGKESLESIQASTFKSKLF